MITKNGDECVYIYDIILYIIYKYIIHKNSEIMNKCISDECIYIHSSPFFVNYNLVFCVCTYIHTVYKYKPRTLDVY